MEEFFPARLGSISEKSAEYTQLKGQLEKLDKKLDAWTANFDSRLTRLESRGSAKKTASVPKKIAKKA